ncbi:hypothetical protein BLNAU_7492 [Blattamonas nauphoetae]|uniref:Uncharacterized protein n=1 Tax=Blattamonas nauphoetae TaxID=2049346 RepID=A0ABQ9Y1L1_9EUKA|nr:hypothetical protein BLNAU_7492 [Blattamonas nauphoetae]
MTESDKKTDTSSSTVHSDLSSPQVEYSMDCSPFLNWDEEELESEDEKVVVFQSLVATMKFQPELDDALEEKAVILFRFVHPSSRDSANAFLSSFTSSSDNSSPDFVRCIGVLLSSANQAITTATIEMLVTMSWICSLKVQFALVKADLIPQLIVTLNPQSLSFEEAEDIHINIMNVVKSSLWLATPNGLASLKIEDNNEQQAVHETVFQQVLAPSEMFIWHLCANRYSIVDGDQSANFMTLLTRLLQICPFYQQTMDFVVNMPVFLTILSFLAFLEDDKAIRSLLYFLNNAQREWNEQREEVREMGKIILRMLRIEGIEDAMEEKLRNDRSQTFGRDIVDRSIKWNNQQGMNL